jgi:ribonucleoside-triphosphate reductase
MKLLADKAKRQENMRLVLEQTPAESTSYRFAKLDLHYYSPASGRVVKGDVSTGEVFYTNSTHLNVATRINPIERVTNEGLFHPLIEAGSISHVWIGESMPTKGAIADFVTKTFKYTLSDQIAFSPEFTICNECSRTSRGLADTCPHCHSENVDGITRITGYFTKISSWNKGKLGELKERYRNNEYFTEKQDRRVV